MDHKDINECFEAIINKKIEEINQMYILKTEKTANKKMNVSDPEKIDYFSKKQINAINTELDQKYKASKAYKNTTLYN
jgi:hypothetical protein